MGDNHLSELQRQKKYLDKLPSNYSFPLFNTRQAVESQRRSGYKNSASAAREIVDNALEAGAKAIHVIFEKGKSGSGRETITKIAFIDDGPGMMEEMAQLALSWGGGTHFEDPDFIGKFGFGLPNASINQTRRVEVYTRTTRKEKIRMACLDINEVVDHGLQTIPEEVVSELPKFVQSYLKANNLTFDNGTVVVWDKPDRLSYKQPATLKALFLDDFGVTYRDLLGPNCTIYVEGIAVYKVDPLFLSPDAKYYLPESEGGAILQKEKFYNLVYVEDTESGATTVYEKKDPQLKASKYAILAEGKLTLRIARFPYGFAVHAARGKVSLDSHRRFDIRKQRRGISFVRAKREIETVDSFPRLARDVSAGLGRWPLLQGYAYHWGMEIRFDPALDDLFSITNDKQGVKPVEDFWRFLTTEKIDDDLHRENQWQSKERQKHKKAQPVSSQEVSPAERAAGFAASIAGINNKIPETYAKKSEENFEKQAKERSKTELLTLKEARSKVTEEIAKKRFKIDFFENAYAPFYEPEWVRDQIVIKINTAHPFFTVFYGPLYKLAGGKKAKESLGLLLITLGKSELETTDPVAQTWYEDRRKNDWSRFLENGLKVLEQDMDDGTEEEESDESMNQ